MRKIIIGLIAALLAITACENEIEVIEADNSPVIILNGLIDASSHTHHVHLSEGRGKRVTSLYGAKVRCYVNGEYVSDGTTDNYNNVLSAPYLFEADLKTGDVLRIETDKGVWAEAIVPKAPVVTKVDTEVIDPAGFEDEGSIKFRISFNDIPGKESFYMADIESSKTRSFQGYAEDETDFSGHYLESDNDPLLNEGRSEDGENVIDDLIGILFGRNEYNIFSDNTFADGSYTLRTKVSYWYLRDALLTYKPSGYPYDYAYSESTARLKVFGLDKTTFRYIKSVNASWTLGSYLITTPVILPTNVNGGLGYLGAMNPGVAEVTFPRRMVPIYEDLYTY